MKLKKAIAHIIYCTFFLGLALPMGAEAYTKNPNRVYPAGNWYKTCDSAWDRSEYGWQTFGARCQTRNKNIWKYSEIYRRGSTRSFGTIKWISGVCGCKSVENINGTLVCDTPGNTTC